MVAHIKHHAKFYFALIAGLLTWLVSQSPSLPVRILIAGDAFFIAYLAATGLLVLNAQADQLRRRSEYADEGISIIILITLTGVGLTLASIFMIFHEPSPSPAWHLILAIISLPLGWMTLHTVSALHYGHLYYQAKDKASGKGKDRGGLIFPGTSEPAAWDFLYYSFVIGMTAQVSDVQVTNVEMRRLTLFQGIVSFFYNTVLMALVLNIVVNHLG